MEKQHILDEIVRTTNENGGAPLGVSRFLSETGIRVADWHGKYWVRWGDALQEAGFTPNQMQGAYDDAEMLSRLAGFINELGRFPVKGDLRMKRRSDSTFPNDKTLRRLGTKVEIASQLIKIYRGQPDFQKAVLLCEPLVASSAVPAVRKGKPAEILLGDVYLIKSSRHYKIGHSNAAGRREREIALQLPEKAVVLHVIKTDDPVGIESYWHRRFAAKRKNGEWFALSGDDVLAFRRRKFM